MRKSIQSPPAESGRPTATAGRKLLLVAVGLVAALLSLAAVEGVLALFGVGDAYLYDDPFVGFAPGRALFSRQVLADGTTVYATNPDKLSFFNQQQFPVEKPAGTYRIFALGGSTTFGRPYDARVAFPRWLELYLNAADPSRRWEVINAGAISYASYRIVLLMKELVRYQPDLFVIYTGHNEFLEERTYEGVLRESPAARRLRVWLSGLRFYALARHGWLAATERDRPHLTRLPGEVSTKLDGWTGLDRYHKDPQGNRAIIEHFRYNLEEMVALARRHGADVVFVEPVSNLKDFSPFKSEHPADLPPAARARFDTLLGEGRARLDAGDPRGALEPFAEAEKIDPDYADLRFRIGRARLALGDFAAARRELTAAKDLDVAPLRAPEAIVRAVGETARRHDLPLVDLPKILSAECEERYGDPIPGNEVLQDHVHPDIETHSRIAEEILAALVRRGIAHPRAGWTEVERRAIFQRELAKIDRPYYAQRDLNLSKVLGWAGKLEEAAAPLRRAAREMPDNPEVHLNLGIVFEKTGRSGPALEELERARQLAPGSAEVRFNLGVVHGELGDIDAGIADLEEAVRLRPGYPEAFYNLGLLYQRAGRLDRAAAALEKAVDLKPDAAEVHTALAAVERARGRFDEARAELAKSLQLAPRSAAAHLGLGVTYAREGDLAAAARELEAALALAPADAEAHFNLGLVRRRQGQTEAAEAEYRKALEANPKHARAANNLGLLLAERGELEAASRLLVGAVQADPSYADAYFNLGVVYDRAGHAGEALRAIEKAVALSPGEGRYRLALGMLYLARGETSKARSELDRAERAGQTIPPDVRRP